MKNFVEEFYSPVLRDYVIRLGSALREISFIVLNWRSYYTLHNDVYKIFFIIIIRILQPKFFFTAFLKKTIYYMHCKKLPLIVVNVLGTQLSKSIFYNS